MLSSDEIAAIRAAHAIRDERLSALPSVLDRGAAIRALSEALESHQTAGRLLDALAASQTRERALAEALAFYAEVREYNRVGGDPVGAPPPIMNDKGSRARAALASAGEDA